MVLSTLQTVAVGGVCVGYFMLDVTSTKCILLFSVCKIFVSIGRGTL